jgi:hypothetical protein
MVRARNFGLLGIAIALWLSLFSSLHAGEIELRWEGVPSASGYRIYFGTASGAYTQSLAVGNRTEATLRGLADCTTWYVAIKAYNGGGESAHFSNEISGWPRPEISHITPSSAEQCSQSVVTISGANFRPGAVLILDEGAAHADIHGNPLVAVDSAGVLSCTEIEALVSVEPAARGSRAAEVGINPVGIEIINPESVWGSGMVDMEIFFNQNRWDINQDDPGTEGRVDGSDLSWLAYAYGSTEGEALYNPDADLNGDGIIDGIDLAYLAAGFGLCWSGSAWVPDECG